MKNNTVYLAIFGVVFVITAGLFYSYWKVTKENPINFLNNIFVKTTKPESNTQNTNSNGVIQSDVYILQEGQIPTVVVEGNLTDYQFATNPQTSENELYAKLSIKEGVLSSRIDSFSVTGKGPGYDYILKDLDQGQKDKISAILEENKAKPASVSGNYIILTSIQTSLQKDLCASFWGPGHDKGWCQFDPTKKSYSAQDLLGLLNTYLQENGQNTNNMSYSKYFSVNGNLLITLQVNYKSLNPNK